MTCSQYHVLQIPIFCVFHLRMYLTLQTIKSTFGPLCSCTNRLTYFTAEFKVYIKDPLMEVLLLSDLLARDFVGLIVRLSAIYTIPGSQAHFRKWRSINTCTAIAEWHHYQQRQRGRSFEASFTLRHERRVHDYSEEAWGEKKRIRGDSTVHLQVYSSFACGITRT